MKKFYCIIVILIICIITSFAQSIQVPYTWSQPIIAEANSANYYPFMTVCENQIILIYQRLTNENATIFCKRQSLNTQKWSKSEVIGFDDHGAHNPHLINNGFTKLAVFWKTPSDKGYQIKYRVSTDNGMTWNVKQEFNPLKNTLVDFKATGMNETMYVVMQTLSKKNDMWQLSYYASYDWGNSWTAARPLLNEKNKFSYDIALDASGIYIIYSNNDEKRITLLHNQLRKRKWKKVYSEKINFNLYNPALYISDRIHLTYIARISNSLSLHYTSASINKPSFDKTDIIYDGLIEIVQPYFTATTYKNNIAWHNLHNGKEDIWIVSKPHSSLKWGKPESFVNSGASYNPSLAAVRDRLIAVWEQVGKQSRAIVSSESIPQTPNIVITSPSHPLDRPSSATVVQLQWSTDLDADKIVGFSYTLDQQENTFPNIIVAGAHEHTTYFKNLNEGRYYFHIRLLDIAGNWSDTVHYPIDMYYRPVLAPVFVDSSHMENPIHIEKNTYFTWKAYSDNIVGYSYSLDSNMDTSPINTIQLRTNYISFHDLKTGYYVFHVRASDSKGRWSQTAHFPFWIQKIPEPAAVVSSESAVSSSASSSTASDITTESGVSLPPVSSSSDLRKEDIDRLVRVINRLAREISDLKQQLVSASAAEAPVIRNKIDRLQKQLDEYISYYQNVSQGQ